jgi:RNA polymerase sigma factor (TIGR02999 family)
LEERSDITPLLEKAHHGDGKALDEVARRVQSDLARLAGRVVARDRNRGARTLILDPTSLVNETFVRLLQQRKRWANREHFFAIATRIMLRVVADHHRARGRSKRAGVQVRLSLGALGNKGAQAPPQVEAAVVAQEVARLDEAEPRAGRVAKLRIFWGLELDEIASVLGVSRSTVDRDWRFARRWLATRFAAR